MLGALFSMTWQKRAKDLIKRRGWSIAELARRAGVELEALYKQLRQVEQPRGDILGRLAAVLGTSEFWLRTGEGLPFTEIPLAGYVSAGESFVQFDDALGELGTVALEFGNQPIAAEVRGASMLPVYRAGDRLLCDKREGATEISQSVNHDCIVMTAKAEGYLKRFTRGSRPGLYTLRSYNPDFQDIENVSVMWVAPIMWVRRGQRASSG